MTAALRLSERLARGDVVLLDGGMGSELEAWGVPMDGRAWSALANLGHADTVERVHEDFLRAGADVIITNTFPAGLIVLDSAGVGDRFVEVNRNAVRAALAARESAGSADVVIAGAIGGLPTATDEHFRDRGLSDEELLAAFSAQAVVLADAGVDVLALEMIGPGRHGRQALAAAAATGLPVWLGVSVLRMAGGLAEFGTLDDDEDRREFERLVEDLVSPEVSVVNLMHSDVRDTSRALDLIRRHWHGPVGAYPHVGHFEAPNWIFEDVHPDRLAAEAATWIDAGAQLVGGCCGIRPAHIAAMRARLCAQA